MLNFQRIVVGLEAIWNGATSRWKPATHPAALAAMARALHLGDELVAEVWLCSTTVSSTEGGAHPDSVKRLRSDLAELTQSAEDAGVAVHIDLDHRPLGDMLRDAAQNYGADLVLRGVVASNDDVAHALVRQSQTAAWLCGTSPIPQAWKIAVFVDLTDAAMPALFASVDAAQSLKAPLHLVFAAGDMPLTATNDSPAELEAKARLQELLFRTDHRTTPFGANTFLEPGDISSAIPAFAAKHGVNLVLLNRPAMVHGSTSVEVDSGQADALLRLAATLGPTCDLLLV